MIEIKKGLVFAGINPLTKTIASKHNEIINIENGMVTVAQYDKYTDDKIIKFTLKEIRNTFRKGLAVVVLAR